MNRNRPATSLVLNISMVKKIENKTPKPEQSIAFADSGTQDYQTLIKDVKIGAKVMLLDTNQNGAQPITDMFKHHANLGCVHILSHGNQNQVYLGNATLNQNTLTTHQSTLSS